MITFNNQREPKNKTKKKKKNSYILFLILYDVIG